MWDKKSRRASEPLCAQRCLFIYCGNESKDSISRFLRLIEIRPKCMNFGVITCDNKIADAAAQELSNMCPSLYFLSHERTLHEQHERQECDSSPSSHQKSNIRKLSMRSVLEQGSLGPSVQFLCTHHGKRTTSNTNSSAKFQNSQRSSFIR